MKYLFIFSKKTNFTIIFFSFFQLLFGQGNVLVSKEIDLIEKTDLSEVVLVTMLVENGSQVDSVILEGSQFEKPNSDDLGLQSLSILNDEECLKWSVLKSRSVQIVDVTIPRLVWHNNEWQKIVKGQLTVYGNKQKIPQDLKTVTVKDSPLNSGLWYKLKVSQTGMYQLSFEFLNEMGIVKNGDVSSEIKVVGNGYGMMSFKNNPIRPLDLIHTPIVVMDGGDGRFNPGDRILFFGQNATNIQYDTKHNMFLNENNIYDDNGYYFVGISEENYETDAKALDYSPNDATIITDAFVVSYNDLDQVNISQSGRRMYNSPLSSGAIFKADLTVEGKPISSGSVLYASATGATESGTFSFSVKQNGSSLISLSGGALSQYQKGYFKEVVVPVTVSENSNQQISLSFNGSGNSSKGYVDKVVLNSRVSLEKESSQKVFYFKHSFVDSSFSTAKVKGVSSSDRIWDVTIPWEIGEYNLQVFDDTGSFVLQTDIPKRIIVFNTDDVYSEPVNLGKVSNQNLHALQGVNMVIVVKPGLRSEANRLAELHRSEGMTVEVVSPDLIYNEFSSGAADAGGIKDFLRYLYLQDTETGSPSLQCVLFFGDGSYVNKNGPNHNANFLPTYQSLNSESLTASYVTDDYFAFLDESDIGDGSRDLMDIGVGRFPITTLGEAKNIVDKIYRYVSTGYSLDEKSPFGNWRNQITFVTDDTDGASDGGSESHMSQANELAQKVRANYPEYLTNKLFLDKYKQETTSGGERYPDAQKAINDHINNGSLIVNYTGHGGELGWAHERILDISMINSWNNYYQMPLFMTATCEFSRFDDPERVSAGELCLLNPNGGAIALMTTNRLVFSGSNLKLNRAFYDNVLPNKESEEYLSIGEIFRRTKVDYLLKQGGGASANHLNFSLLGDPALKLAYPKLQVVLDSLNGKLIENLPDSVSKIDTLQGLSKIIFKGRIINTQDEFQSGFNGHLYVSVFDKERELETLANDEAAPYKYTDYVSRLYKGKATVSDGKFKVEFILPKDIAFNKGLGLMNFYATNGVIDANGSFDQFTIDGLNSNPPIDNIGPDIDIFLNDMAFNSGDITNQTPLLITHLSDSSGINTTGTGVGHNIVAILNAETDNPIVLTSLYEADLDDYTSGSIQYEMPTLLAGEYTLTLRAWDVLNNAGARTINFTVVDEEQVEIQNLLAFPNPSAGETSFKFTHNQAGNIESIKLRVYDSLGREVAMAYWSGENIVSQNTIIQWSGENSAGDTINTGLYVYKLIVVNKEGALQTKTGRISVQKL